MNKLTPNSIESVIMFILYICMQDGEVSKEESKELIATAPLIQKMYLDMFGEYIPQDLDYLIGSAHESLFQYFPEKGYQGNSSSDIEIFSKLLTDNAARDIALLASRNTAGSDGLHKLEKQKYEFWYEQWNT